MAFKSAKALDLAVLGQSHRPSKPEVLASRVNTGLAGRFAINLRLIANFREGKKLDVKGATRQSCGAFPGGPCLAHRALKAGVVQVAARPGAQRNAAH